MAFHRVRVLFDRPLKAVGFQLGHQAPLTARPRPAPAREPEPKSAPAPPPQPNIDVKALEVAAEQRGYERARAEQMAHVQAVLDALQRDLTAMKEQQDQLARNVATSVEGIAFSIAERVVEREIERGHYDLPALIAECFAPLSPDHVSGDVTVYVNRQDFQSLEEILKHPSLAAWRDQSIRLEIQPDLEPASCRIVAGPLVVSTDPGSRLEVVRRGLDIRKGDGHVPA
ncbi:MAG: FliH/SctL family protein [Planctomycetota bacterium]